MKNKWIKLGTGVIALIVVAGLSLGAVMTAQAQDSWFGLGGGRVTFAQWFGGPRGLAGHGQAGSLATIAKALGVSESDLTTALQAGKSVADVAKEKNVDLSKVVDAIVAEQTDALKQAVSNGRLTQQQADARIAKLKTDLPNMLSRKFTAGARGSMLGKGGMGPMGSFATIAKALGISESDLTTALQAGKSVADVAKEKNVDLSKVVDAIVAEHSAALKQAVSSGRITQQQADAMVAKMKTDLPNMLSKKFPTGARGFAPGKNGMGPMGSFATIAKALGISESDLTTALRSGKSVADVAQEKSVDLNKVVDAIVAEMTDTLKQAVSSGRLTQQQADQRIATLKANLPHLLSLKYGMGGMMGPGRRSGGQRFNQPDTQQSDGVDNLLAPAQST